MSFGRLRISAPFALAFSAFYFFDRSGAFVALVLACAAHEAGHIAAIVLLGGRITEAELSLCGACIRHSIENKGKKDAAVAASGPAANLLCAALFAGKSGLFGLFAAASLLLDCFNLLPAHPLDGWRIVRTFLKNEKAVAAVSFAAALLAAALGAVLFVFSGSPMLLLSGVTLALRQRVMYNNMKKY